MFTQLDRWLANDWSPDYWADLGCCESVAMLAKFSCDDWTLLAAALPDRSPKWLERCIECLELVPCDESRRLLLVLTESEREGIAMAAFDAFKSLIFSEVALGPYRQPLLNRVGSFRSKASKYEHYVLDAIVRNIGD